jgi:hypothetical protein
VYSIIPYGVFISQCIRYTELALHMIIKIIIYQIKVGYWQTSWQYSSFCNPILSPRIANSLVVITILFAETCHLVRCCVTYFVYGLVSRSWHSYFDCKLLHLPDYDIGPALSGWCDWSTGDTYLILPLQIMNSAHAHLCVMYMLYLGVMRLIIFCSLSLLIEFW